METVEISSSGNAADHQPACMGIYMKTKLLVQGYPVYEKSKEGENYFLFVGQYGEWVVAQNIKEVDLWVLKNSTKKPTPKIPPKKMWLYIHPQGDSDVPIIQRWVEDDTIEVIAKEDCEISGNTYAEQFLVKCGLEKYIPSLLENGITKHYLRRVHNGIAYYPENSEQRHLFQSLGVSLDESLIMRKMLQEEKDEAFDKASDVPDYKRDYFKGILDGEIPCFPYNVATVCHGSLVTAIAHFGTSGFFFTGGVGGTVRLWNTDPTIPPPHHRHASSSSGIPPPYSLAPKSRKFYTPIVEFNLGNNDSIFDEKNESVVNCMTLFGGSSESAIRLGLMVGGEFQGRKSIQLIMFENVPPTNPTFEELGSFSKKCLDFAICEGNTLLYCCQRSSLKEKQEKEDRLVEIWDLTTMKMVGVLEGHDDSVTCLAISESTEEKKLFSGGRDHAVIVWDLQTKTQLQKFDLSGRVRSLSCHPTKEMAIATTDIQDNDERRHCMVSVMTADNPEVERIDLRLGTKFQNTSLMQPRFAPTGHWFMTAGKGVSGCVPPAGPKLFTLPNQKEATCCQFIFGMNGKPLMALGYDDKVEILNYSVRPLDTGYDSDSD